MGKRKKASKPQGPKKREVLATTFQCLFCNHENSVSVKIEKKLGIGYLTCKVCGQSFQIATNYLSEPIDVYSEWVDACDAVAKGQEIGIEGQTASSYRGTGSVKADQSGRQQDRYEGDDFVVDDEPDLEDNFRDED